MEAKVDVRKLQLLNDRIAQTIEALNQVRLSVHGLTHTPGLPSTIPFVPAAVPFPGYGAMTPGFPPYQGIWPGLQHTPYTPIAPIAPFTQFSPLGLPNVSGFTPPPFILQHTPYTPIAPIAPIAPFTQFSPLGLPNVSGFTPPPFVMSGLSHTSPEVIEQRLLELRPFDPYRLAQTFPYLSTPYWPTLW